MFDFKPHKKEREKIKHEIPSKGEKQYVGSLRLKGKNHKCFKLNIKTGLVSEVDVETTAVAFKKGKKDNKQLVVEDNCFYVTSLNMKNAIRKFKQKGLIK